MRSAVRSSLFACISWEPHEFAGRLPQGAGRVAARSAQPTSPLRRRGRSLATARSIRSTRECGARSRRRLIKCHGPPPPQGARAVDAFHKADSQTARIVFITRESCEHAVPESSSSRDGPARRLR